MKTPLEFFCYNELRVCIAGLFLLQVCQVANNLLLNLQSH